VAALLIAYASLCGNAQAASEPDAAQIADWERRNVKAAELKDEARRMQEEAKRLYDVKSKACFEKFQVTACRNEAHKEHSEQIAEARRVENQGKALEREVRKEQLADRDARHLAEADQRAADLRKREAETSADRRGQEAHEAALRAGKEKDADEGAKRRAADAERIQKKQADHAAKVARKKEEAAARKAAENPAR